MVKIQVFLHVQHGIPSARLEDDCLPNRDDLLRLLGVSGHSSTLRSVVSLSFQLQYIKTNVVIWRSDYVDQQEFIGNLDNLAAVYNDDFVGIASYNILVGVAVATVFGAAFFFDLFWPERKESPSVHLAWKICAVIMCVMALGDALAMTVCGVALPCQISCRRLVLTFPRSSWLLSLHTSVELTRQQRQPYCSIMKSLF